MLVNHRMQIVKDAEGNDLSSISRSGAVSDFSHGAISLQELKDYPVLLEMQNRNTPTLSDYQLKLCNLYGLCSSDKAGIDHEKLEMLCKSIQRRAVTAYGGQITDEERGAFRLICSNK